MAKVLFKRYETDAEAQASNIIDGQFIVTKEGTSYTDYGTDRVAFGGTLDTQMSDSSINGVQNKVIKSYTDNKVNDAIQEAKEYVDEKQTYSTDEVVIGTWIDNKPIYRKVINIGNLPNNATVNIPTSTFDASNKFITNIYCIGVSSQGEYLKIPYYAGTSNYTNILITSANTISIQTNADRSRFTGYVTVEYTKTND